jgi:O-antigen/teichoic acid export membrane protein
MGFTFWIIVARLFPASEVGQASALVSATSLIAYFALLGLNSTIFRFLPTAADKGSLVTGAFSVVAGCAAAIGLGYVFLTPVFAPRLSFISHKPALALGFVLLNVAVAINLMTDSVFVSSRRANLCALTDGGFGGLGRIAFAVLLAGTGAYGLFVASAAGFALAALVSIVLILTSLRLRPSFKGSLRAIRPLLRFSGASYSANVLNLLPNVVVPLMVLDRLGPKPAAYYFVAFQIAALLYAAVQAVEGAFLSEGSQADANWRQIRSRSRRIAAILFVPGCAILLVGAHWLLLMFGDRYSQNGTGSLELLAIAVIPVAFCNWSWTVLRLTGRLRALVVSNAVFALGICGTAWILLPHGLTAVAAAWPIGCTIAACVATAAAGSTRDVPQARHRRRPPRADPVARQSD